MMMNFWIEFHYFKTSFHEAIASFTCLFISGGFAYCTYFFEDGKFTITVSLSLTRNTLLSIMSNGHQVIHIQLPDYWTKYIFLDLIHSSSFTYLHI